MQTKENFQRKCLSFTPEAYVFNSTRQVLDYVQAGTNITLSYNDPTCERPNQVVAVDLCRVALSIATSNRSSITFELWLPTQWSGRLLGTGNGGLDGCIKYEDLAYTASNGFASFGSNNGHNGTSGVAFDRNPDVVIDYAWRSLHTSVLAGKKLSKLFYKTDYKKSYYLGCSSGGRQGMKASEMFPDDFDGIVAGSPALDFNNLVSWRANFFPLTGSVDSPDFITPSTWTNLIHNEILKQCDRIDGVIDGILEHPELCKFRPEALTCVDGIVTDCLTTVQVQIVQKIFSPLYGEDNNLIYPAMQPGSEVMAVKKLYAGKPFSYSEDWFKYVVFNDSMWDASTFTVADAAVAEALNPSNIRTWPDDLSTFRDLGGKIISYHGSQDNQITSFNTERFYDYLSRGMQALPSELDDFFRFFRVSGMFHCNSAQEPGYLVKAAELLLLVCPLNVRTMYWLL
ncbi:putative feruloyl esterase B-2 [Sticta canariensis]|nr:putative feruloyl esterase B-2 [Sticta canariensis]